MLLDDKVMGIARAYGKVQRALAERSNAERIRLAQANFNTGRAQIEAAAGQEVSELSSIFRKHIGSIQSSAAVRGVGGASIQSLESSATAEAIRARTNIEINANNQIGSLASQSQVQIEDPALAEFSGVFQGLGIGSDFLTALQNLPENRRTRTEWVRGPSGGYQAIQITESSAQNFDIRSQFPELDAFLEGMNGSAG